MLAKLVKVIGKVQGVWFRKGTQLEAIKLGLKGTVQNLPDGSVLIKVYGEEKQVDKMLEWCKTGTPNAEVKQLHTSNIPFEVKEDFIIIR